MNVTEYVCIHVCKLEGYSRGGGLNLPLKTHIKQAISSTEKKTNHASIMINCAIHISMITV